MKAKRVIENPGETRRKLIEWYASPGGASLKAMEAAYLSRAISFRYNQDILQIGSLGWEKDYQIPDCGYQFWVVDRISAAQSDTPRILAHCDRVPIDSNNVDVVIVPHCLEFEPDPHNVLREAERVLKPEGQLIFLGFNPWCFQAVYHFPKGRRGVIPWCGNFLSYPRIRDWLALLNFEYDMKSTVFFTKSRAVPVSKSPLYACTAIGFAIKAIKRRYTLIPLAPAKSVSRNLLAADITSSRISEP